MQVMALQGDTIDSLCWRYYGRTEGMVEQVMDANQNLSYQDLVLPLGTRVELPDNAVTNTTSMIQLWD